MRFIFYILQSYAEFHADVFPDTYSGEPGCDVTAWLGGANPQVIFCVYLQRNISHTFTDLIVVMSWTVVKLTTLT